MRNKVGYLLETLGIVGYAWYHVDIMRDKSLRVSRTRRARLWKPVNQQGSRSLIGTIAPSETTRRTPVMPQEIRAYLLGTLHDGTYSSNCRFRIAQKGAAWLKILKRLFKYLGQNSWIYREGKNRSVYVLETLASWLDFGFNPLRLKTTSERRGYIRGFFDAEGGIPRRRSDRFYIQLVQKDKVKISRIKGMLNKMKISSGKIHNPSVRVDPDYWRIFILARSHQNFIKKIGSWHPRKRKILADREMI